MAEPLSIAEVVRRKRERLEAQRLGLADPWPAEPVERMPRSAAEQWPQAFKETQRRRTRAVVHPAPALSVWQAETRRLSEPRRLAAGPIAEALLPDPENWPDGTTDAYVSVDSKGQVRLCFEIDGGC